MTRLPCCFVACARQLTVAKQLFGLRCCALEAPLFGAIRRAIPVKSCHLVKDGRGAQTLQRCIVDLFEPWRALRLLTCRVWQLCTI